jgi:crotonobetaine/carnitine-CoA ligase
VSRLFAFHTQHPDSLRRVVLRGALSFAAAEIRNEGYANFLRTLGASIAARDLRMVPNRSFGEELAVRSKRDPQRVFIEFEGQQLSYADLDHRAACVAAALEGLGVARGGSVGVLLPNLPAFLEIIFASQRVGACAVPINTGLKGEGLRHVLDNASVDVLFTTEALRPAYEQVRGQLATPPLLIVVPEREGEPESSMGTPYAELLRTWPQAAPDASVPPELPSLLMYTSGTTGHPKGVVYRYGHSQAKLARLGAHLLLTKDDIYYTCLPLFHANALMVTVLHSLFAGARVVLSRRFSASRFWPEVRQSRATIFNAMGTLLAILAKADPDPRDRDHCVRRVLSAACPAHLWLPFQERFGVKLWESYGAVDGGGFATFNLGDAPAGSIGRPLLAAKYRLVDGAGHDVPVGTPGELVHHVGRRQHAQVAYHADPGATRDKVRGGWVHSGDLLRRDDQGYLYFVGRKTDSMRCGGENVSARDVEDATDAYPEVLESAAFGVPSALGEEDVMIAVQPRQGHAIDPAALHAFVSERLPRFATPKYVRVLEQLPKTATFRTIKGALRRDGVTPDTWRAPDPRRSAP